MSRRSQSYLINDSEFDALDELATTSKQAWAALSVAISMISGAILDAGLTQTVSVGFMVGWCSFWAVIAAVSGIFLIYRRGRRDRYIDRIKRESFRPGDSGG